MQNILIHGFLSHVSHSHASRGGGGGGIPYIHSIVCIIIDEINENMRMLL